MLMEAVQALESPAAGALREAGDWQRFASGMDVGEAVQVDRSRTPFLAWISADGDERIRTPDPLRANWMSGVPLGVVQCRRVPSCAPFGVSAFSAGDGQFLPVSMGAFAGY